VIALKFLNCGLSRGIVLAWKISGETERRPGSARIAGCAVIVLDASVVAEPLTNGALAHALRRRELRHNFAAYDAAYIALAKSNQLRALHQR
jgi:hypothetical protein